MTGYFLHGGGGKGRWEAELGGRKGLAWRGGGIESVSRENGHLCLQPSRQRKKEDALSALGKLKHRGVSKSAVGFLSFCFPSG